MKVLVTGASGFLGSYVVPALWVRGHEITALDIRKAPESPAAEELVCDLTIPGEVAAALSGRTFDAVMHLAVPSRASSSDVLHSVNIQATRTLLMNLSGRAGKVVLASSSAAYGRVSPAQFPVREDTPSGFTGPYGRSFMEREEAAKLSTSISRTDLYILRVFNLIGPGQDPDSIVPDVARKLALAGTGEYPGPLVTSPISWRRDYIDARDAALAFVEALAATHSGITVVNICSGRSFSGEEVIRALAGTFGAPEPKLPHPEQAESLDIDDLPGDPSAALRLLGWKPAISFERTLADVAEEWRNRVREAKA
jgi:GDP-4-dehydro-6-deoxy-D-mannose reductase